MWIECDYSRHCAGSTRTLDNCAHDQLMTEMQTIEHAECEHCWPLNLRVISSVKKAHIYIADFQLPIVNLLGRRHRSNWQLAIGNWQCLDDQSVVSKFDARRQPG